MMDFDNNSFTVHQLKCWLKKLNLKSSGNKSELLLRLREVPIEKRGSAPPLIDEAECSESEPEQEVLTEIVSEISQSSIEQRESDLLKNELVLQKRECEMLKREKALLEKENDFLKMATTHHQSNTTSSPVTQASEVSAQIPLNILKELIPTFDGNTNVEFWVSQVKNITAAYDINDVVLKAIIANKLSGKALAWLHSNTDFVNHSAEETLTAMKFFFGSNENKLYLRRNFESRKWIEGETFSAYFNDKILLARNLLVEEDELIDYIIDGITNEQLQIHAKLQCFRSRDQLLQAFSKISLKTMKQERSGNDRKKLRCYNCNMAGHFASECRKPKREFGSCFQCGSKTHMVSDCPERKKQVCCLEEDEYVKSFNYVFNKNYNLTISLGTLIDSGSPISFIKKSLIRKFNISFVKIENDERTFFGLNNSKLIYFGEIECFIIFGKCKIKMKLLIVAENTMNVDVVLGRDFLQKSNSKLVLGCETSSESSSKCQNVKEVVTNINNDRGDNMNFEKQLLQIDYDNINKGVVVVGDAVTETEKNKFYYFFEKLYATANRPEEPLVKCEMKIILNCPKPFYCPPRRISYTERKELQELLDDYLNKGYIRPSHSEYTSAIVLRKKKTGDLRMCVDFRILNKSTCKDNYPIPHIDDLLDRLAQKKIFTKLDLKNGFFHVYMHPDSVKYTSFITPLGQFEFLRMPFGLRNAPSVFQRFINTIFNDLIREDKLTIYLDDIMIASESFSEHLSVLKEVFQRLVNNNLELRLDKCEFLQSTVKYLGYTITSAGVRADEKGLEAIRNFPLPSKVQGVQSFLGLCSYFRRFIKDFSTLAKPLYDLVKKDVKFQFEEKELECFQLLKNKLLEAPILAFFSPDDETELHCDASKLGFGAILLQKKADGKNHPIFYFSKRTTETESKYHSFELEMLAIIYALKRFRIYLQGKHFKIITDCNSLTLTLKKKELNPRIARWALELENYDFALEHRESNRMQHVDALSRSTNILTLNCNTFEENLIICQGKDVEIEKLRNSLENTESNLYEMRNGIVYRKKEPNKILFYVPQTMEKQIIFKYHDEMGHLGVDKVVDLILNHYWFPKMKEKVNNYIQNCLKCIVYSSKQNREEGFLHNIPKGNLPFEMIHVDHFGPVDNSVKIKKYILVVIDAFTKFVRLYCTKTTNTREVINALSDYFRAYSRPKTLISDRGSCFTSSDFTKFLHDHNVQHIKVATASPQANGQVERINRCIKPMIAKLVDIEKGIDWVSVVERVEFALNNSWHRATKEYPSVMLFGRLQRGQVTDSLGEKLTEILPKSIPTSLKGIRAKAVLNQKELQTYNKTYVNKKRTKPRTYKTGDYVMIRNFDSQVGTHKKLIPRYKGPYKVSKVLRNDRYVLCDVENFQQNQIPYIGVWAVSNIRPWLDSEENT